MKRKYYQAPAFRKAELRFSKALCQKSLPVNTLDADLQDYDVDEQLDGDENWYN